MKDNSIEIEVPLPTLFDGTVSAHMHPAGKVVIMIQAPKRGGRGEARFVGLTADQAAKLGHALIELACDTYR